MCLKRPSCVCEFPWMFPLPPAALSLVRCSLWYGKTCRQLSPAGDRCPTGENGEETAHREWRISWQWKKVCFVLLLAKLILPCIVVPLWGFSHLSALWRPGNEDLSHLLNLLQDHSEVSVNHSSWTATISPIIDYSMEKKSPANYSDNQLIVLIILSNVKYLLIPVPEI